MNPSTMKGLVAGLVIATAGGAIAAGYGLSDKAVESAATPVVAPLPEYAEVVAVAPLTEKMNTQREVCEEVPVTVQAPARDKHKIAGTTVGALIGGAIGNQIGGGSGKKIATVAGAAAGGFAGNKIQQRAQSNDTTTVMETRCHMVTDTKDKLIGYDVTYLIGSIEGNVRMDQKPGERIPLQDGELAIN